MFRLQFKILRKTHLLTPDVFHRYKNTPSCSLKRQLYNHLKVPMSRKLSKLLNIFNKQSQKWSTFNCYNNTDFKHFTNINNPKSVIHKISKFKNCKSKKSVALLKKITKAISSKKCGIKKCGVRSGRNLKECSCNKHPNDSLLIKIELPKEEYSVAKPLSNSACLTKIRSYNTLCAKYSKLQHILSKISRNNYKLRHCSTKHKDDDKLFHAKGRHKKSSINKLKTNKKSPLSKETDKKSCNLKSDGDCLLNHKTNTIGNLRELQNHHALRVAKMKKNSTHSNPDKRNRKKIINIIIEITGTDNDDPKHFNVSSTTRTINILNEDYPEEVINENIYERLDNIPKDLKFSSKNTEKMCLDPTKIATGRNENFISSYLESEFRNRKVSANKEHAASSKKKDNILPSEYKTKDLYDSKFNPKESNFSVGYKSKKNINSILESDVKMTQNNLDVDFKKFKNVLDKQLFEAVTTDDQTKANKKNLSVPKKTKEPSVLDVKTKCKNQILECLLETGDQNRFDSPKIQTVHNKHRKLASINLKTDPENIPKRFKYVTNTCENLNETMHSKNLDMKIEPQSQKEILKSPINVVTNVLDPIKKTQEYKAKFNLKNKTAEHKKWLKFIQQKNKEFRKERHEKYENNTKKDSQIHWISFKSECSKAERTKQSYNLNESNNENNITKCQLKPESNRINATSFPCFQAKIDNLEKNSNQGNFSGTEDINKDWDKQLNITENYLHSENENKNYKPCENNIYSNVDKPVNCEDTSLTYSKLKTEGQNAQESLRKNANTNLCCESKIKNQNEYESKISTAKNNNQEEFVAKQSEIDTNTVINQPISSVYAYNCNETGNEKIKDKKSLKSEIDTNTVINQPISSVFAYNCNETGNEKIKDKKSWKSESIENENIYLSSAVNKSENQKYITKDMLDSACHMCNALSPCDIKKKSENKSNKNTITCEPIKNEMINSPVSINTNYKSNTTDPIPKSLIFNSKIEPKNEINNSEIVSDSMKNQTSINVSSCFKTDINNQNSNNWSKFQSKPNEIQNTKTLDVNIQNNIAANDSLSMSNRYNNINETVNQNISKQNTTIQSIAIENNIPSNDLNSTCNYDNCKRNGFETVPSKSLNASSIPNKNSTQKNVAFNLSGIKTEAEIKKTYDSSSYSTTETMNQKFNATDCINPLCSNEIHNKKNTKVNELEYKEMNNQSTNIVKPEEIQIQEKCINIDSTKSPDPINIDNNQTNITKTKLDSETNKSENITSYSEMQPEYYNMNPETKLLNQNMIEPQSKSNETENAIPLLGSQKEVDQMKNIIQMNVQSESNNTENICSDKQNESLEVSKNDSDFVPNITSNSKGNEHKTINSPNVMECKPEDVQNNKTNLTENELEFVSYNKTSDFTNEKIKHYIREILLKKVKPDHRVFKVRPYVKQQYCYEEITPQYLQKKSLDQHVDGTQMSHNENSFSLDCNEQTQSIRCKTIKPDKHASIENKLNISDAISNQIAGMTKKEFSPELKQTSQECEEKTSKQQDNELQLENKLKTEKKYESAMTNNTNNQETALKANSEQLAKKFEKEAEGNLINKSKNTETELKELKYEAANKFEFYQNQISGNTSSFEPTKNKEMLRMNNNETCSSELNHNVIASPSQKEKNAQVNYDTNIDTNIKINNEKQGTNTVTDDKSEFKCKTVAATTKLNTNVGLEIIGSEIKNANKMKQNYSLENKTESGNPNKKIAELQSLSKNTDEIFHAKKDKTNPELVATQLYSQNASPTIYASNNTTDSTTDNKYLSEIGTSEKVANLSAIESNNQNKQSKKALLSALIKFNSLLSKEVTKAIEIDNGNINITAELYCQLKKLKCILTNETNRGKKDCAIRHHDANQIEYETIKTDLLNALVKFNNIKADTVVKQEKNKKTMVDNKKKVIANYLGSKNDKAMNLSKNNDSDKISNNSSKTKKIKKQLKKVKYIVTRKFHKTIGNKQDPKIKRHKFQSNINNDDSKFTKCKSKTSINNYEIKKGKYVMKAFHSNLNINFTRTNGIDRQNYNSKKKLHTAPAIYSNFSSKGPNNNDGDEPEDKNNQKPRNKLFHSEEEYINSLSLVNVAPGVYKVPDKQTKYKKLNEDRKSNTNKILSSKMANQTGNEEKKSKRYNFCDTLKPNEKQKSVNKDESLSKAKTETQPLNKEFAYNFSNTLEKNLTNKKESIKSKRNRIKNKYQFNTIRQKSTPYDVPAVQTKTKTNIGVKTVLNTSSSKKSIKTTGNKLSTKTGGVKFKGDHNTVPDNKSKRINKIQMVSNNTSDNTSNKNKIVLIKAKEDTKTKLSTDTKIASNNPFTNLKSDSTKQNRTKNKLNAVKMDQDNTKKPSPEIKVKIDKQVTDLSKINTKYKYIIPNEPYHIKEVEVTNDMGKVELEEDDETKSIPEALVLIDGHTDNLDTSNINKPYTSQGKIKIEENKSVQDSKAKTTLETKIKPDNVATNKSTFPKQKELKMETKNTEVDTKNKAILEAKAKPNTHINAVPTLPFDSNQTLEIKIKIDDQSNNVGTISKTIKLVQDSKETTFSDTKTVHRIIGSNKDQDEDKFDINKLEKVKLNNVDFEDTDSIPLIEGSIVRSVGNDKNTSTLETKIKNERSDVKSNPSFNESYKSGNQDKKKLDAAKSKQETPSKSSPETNLNSDNQVPNMFNLSIKYKYPFTNVPFRNRAVPNLKNMETKSVDGNKNPSAPKTDLQSGAEIKNTDDDKNKSLLEKTVIFSPETRAKSGNQTSNKSVFQMDSNKMSKDQNKIETKKSDHDNKDKLSLGSKTNISDKASEKNNYLVFNKSNQTLEIKIKTDDQPKNVSTIPKTTKSLEDSKEKTISAIETVHKFNKAQEMNKLDPKKSEQELLSLEQKIKSMPTRENSYYSDSYETTKSEKKNKMEIEKSMADNKNSPPETKIKIEYQLSNMKSNPDLNESYKSTENQNMNKLNAVKTQQDTTKSSPEANTNPDQQLHNYDNAYTKYKYPFTNVPFRNKENQYQNMETEKSVEGNKNQPSPEVDMKVFHETKHTNADQSYSYPMESYQAAENYLKNKMESNKSGQQNSNMYSPENNMKANYQAHSYSAVQNYSYPNENHQNQQRSHMSNTGQQEQYSFDNKIQSTNQNNIGKTESYNYVNTAMNQQGSKSNSAFKTVELGNIVNNVEPKSAGYNPIDKFDLPTYLVSRTQNQKDTYNAIKNENKSNECIFKYFNDTDADSHLDEYDRPNYYSFTPNEDYPDTDYSILVQKNISKSTNQENKNNFSSQPKSKNSNDVDTYDLPTYNNDYVSDFYPDTDNQKIYPKSVIVYQQNSNIPFRAENNQNMNIEMKSKLDQSSMNNIQYANNSTKMNMNNMPYANNSNKTDMNNMQFANNSNKTDMNQNVNKEEKFANVSNVQESVPYVTLPISEENLDEFDRPSYNINHEIYKSKPDIIRVEKYQLLKDDKGNYNLEMKYQYINVVDNSVVHVHGSETNTISEKLNQSAKHMQQSSPMDHNDTKLDDNTEYGNHLNNNNRFNDSDTTAPRNPYINPDKNTEDVDVYRANKAFPIMHQKRKKIKLGRHHGRFNMEYGNESNNLNNSFDSATSMDDKSRTDENLKDQEYLENLHHLRSDTANSIINSHKKPVASTNDSSTPKKHLGGNLDGGSQNTSPDKKILSPETGFGNNSTSTRMLSQSSFYNQNLQMLNKNIYNNRYNINSVIAANLVKSQFKHNGENVLQNWGMDDKIKDIDKKILAPDKFLDKSYTNNIKDDILNPLKFPLSGDIPLEPKNELEKKFTLKNLTEEEVRRNMADINKKSEIMLRDIELENKLIKMPPQTGAESALHVYKVPSKEKHSPAVNKPKVKDIQDNKIMTVFRSANTDFVNYSNNNLKNIEYQYANLESQTNHVPPVYHSGPLPYKHKYTPNSKLWPNNEFLKNESFSTNFETTVQTEPETYNFSMKNLEKSNEPLEIKKNSNNMGNQFQSGLTVAADNSNLKTAFHSGPSVYMNIKSSISKQEPINTSTQVSDQDKNIEAAFILKAAECAFLLNENFELENRVDAIEPTKTGDIIVHEKFPDQNLLFVSQAENRIDQVEPMDTEDKMADEITQNQTVFFANRVENNINSVHYEPTVAPLVMSPPVMPQLQSETETVNQNVKSNYLTNDSDITVYPQNYTCMSSMILQPEITTYPSNFESDLYFPTQNPSIHVSEDVTVNQITEADVKLENSKINKNDFICNPKKFSKTRLRKLEPNNQKVTKTFRQNNDLMRTLMSKTLIKYPSVSAVNISNEAVSSTENFSNQLFNNGTIVQSTATTPECLEHSKDIFPSYIQEQKFADNQLNQANTLSSDVNYRYNAIDSGGQYGDILQMFHPKSTKTVIRRRKTRFESTNGRFGSRDYSYFLTGHLNAPLDSFSNNKVPNNSKHYFSSISNKELQTTEIKTKSASASKISKMENDVISTSIQEGNSLNKFVIGNEKCFESNESNNSKLLDRIISSYGEICSENENYASKPKNQASEQNDESSNPLGKLIISVMPKEKSNTKLSEHINLSKSHTANIICTPIAKEKQSGNVPKAVVLSAKEMPNILDHMNGKTEITCTQSMLNPNNNIITDFAIQTSKQENKTFEGNTPKPEKVATSTDKQGSSEKIPLNDIYLDRNQSVLNLLTNLQSTKEASSVSHKSKHLDDSIGCSSAKSDKHKSESFKDKTTINSMSCSRKSLEESIAKITKENSKPFKGETISSTLSLNNEKLEKSIVFSTPNTKEEKSEIKKKTLTCNDEYLGASITYSDGKINEGKCDLFKSETKINTLSPSSEILKEITASPAATKTNEGVIKPFKNETLSPSNKDLERNIACSTAKAIEEKSKTKNNTLTGSIAYPAVKISEAKSELFKSKTKHNTLSPSSEYLHKSSLSFADKTNEGISKSLKSETINIALSPTTNPNEEKIKIKIKTLTRSNENLEGSILHPTAKISKAKSELFKSKTKNKTLSSSSEYLAKSTLRSAAKISKEASKPFKSELKNIALSPNNDYLEKSIARFSTKTKDKTIESFDCKPLDMNSLNKSLSHSNEHLPKSIRCSSAKSEEEKSGSLKNKTPQDVIGTPFIDQELTDQLPEDTLSLNQYSQHRKSIVNFLHCLDSYRGLNEVNNILAQNCKHAARIICSPRKTMQSYNIKLADDVTSKLLSNVEKLSTNQFEQPKVNSFNLSENIGMTSTNGSTDITQQNVPQLAIKIIVPSDKINSIVVKCSMDSLDRQKQKNIKTTSQTDIFNPIVSTKSVQRCNSITTTAKKAHVPKVLLENHDKIVKSNPTKINEQNIYVETAKTHGSDCKSVPKSILAENVFKETTSIKDSSNLLSQNSKFVGKNSVSIKEDIFGTLEKRSDSNKNIATKNVIIKQDANMKSTTIPQNANESDSLQRNKKSDIKLIPKSVDGVKEKLETVNKVNYSNTHITKLVGMEATSISPQTNVKELKSLPKKNDANEFPKEEKRLSPERKVKVKEVLPEKPSNKLEVKTVRDFLKTNKKETESVNLPIDINYLTMVDDGKKYTTSDTRKKTKDKNSLSAVTDEQNVKFTSIPHNKNTELIREPVTEETSSKKAESIANEKAKEQEADALIKLFNKAIQAIESINVNNILNVRFKKVTTLSQENNVSSKILENESIKDPLPENKESIEIIMKPVKNADNNLGVKNTQSVLFDKKSQDKHKTQSTTKPKSPEKSASRTVCKDKNTTTKQPAKSSEPETKSGSKKETLESPQGKKIDATASNKTPLKKVEDSVASKDNKSTLKDIQIQDNAIFQESMQKFEKQVIETIIKNIPSKKNKPAGKPLESSKSKSTQKMESNEIPKENTVKTPLINETLKNAIKIIEQNNSVTSDDNKKTLEQIIIGDSMKEENVNKVLRLKGDFEILEKILKPQENMLLNTENLVSNSSKCFSTKNQVFSESMEAKCSASKFKTSSEKSKAMSTPKIEALSSTSYKKPKQDLSPILNKKIEKTPKNAKKIIFTPSDMIYESVKRLQPSSIDKLEGDVIRSSIVRSIFRKDLAKLQKPMEIDSTVDDPCSLEKITNSNVVEETKSYEHNHDSVLSNDDIIFTTVLSEDSLCEFPKQEPNYEPEDNTYKTDNNIQYDDNSVCRAQEGECVVKLTKEDKEFIEFRRNSSQYNGFINLGPSECVKDETGTYVYISKFDH